MTKFAVGDRVCCSTKFGRRVRRSIVYGTILYVTKSHLAACGDLMACVEFDFCHICDWTDWWWSAHGTKRHCKMYHTDMIPVQNLKKATRDKATQTEEEFEK